MVGTRASSSTSDLNVNACSPPFHAGDEALRDAELGRKLDLTPSSSLPGISDGAPDGSPYMHEYACMDKTVKI
jgi:hypothetical protein